MATDILLFGAGAVGAFYGSRLAQAGARVSCICRSNLAAVKANGFNITSPIFKQYQWRPTNAFSSAAEATQSGTSWDYIIVATKALPDIQDDSVHLQDLVGRQTVIVLLQNGLGIEEPYSTRFPDNAILSAVTIISSSQSQPGFINHARWTRINIGSYLLPGKSTTSSSDSPSFEAKAFAKLLQDGGIRDAFAYSHKQMQLLRWHKVAINAAMNPSAVLSGGCSPSAMALDSELSRHLKGVIDEVLHTAPKIVGEEFSSDFASSNAILQSVQKNKSGSMPSMWADWTRHKPMELEVILGNPIRMVRQAGYDMPRVQSLYALLKMAQARRGQSGHVKANL